MQESNHFKWCHNMYITAYKSLHAINSHKCNRGDDQFLNWKCTLEKSPQFQNQYITINHRLWVNGVNQWSDSEPSFRLNMVMEHTLFTDECTNLEIYFFPPVPGIAQPQGDEREQWPVSGFADVDFFGIVITTVTSHWPIPFVSI